MIYQGAKKYPVDEVVLHTSATPGDWWEGKSAEDMAREIRFWHLDRGWSDIGYHYVVAPDGSYAKGRAVTTIGAGVKGHNRGKVHICMIPSKMHDGIKRFSAYFTEHQHDTVKKLIAAIPGIKRVSGHNDYTNAKECPGFRVNSTGWLTAPEKRGLLYWLTWIFRAIRDWRAG